MIRAIAAIDNTRGLATDDGIPWDLPSDKAYFRDKTNGGVVLMGYATYQEFDEPLPNRRNLVATSSTEDLRPGFEKIPDARKFLEDTKDDIWVMGGAGTYASVFDLVEELYITQLDGDWHCTKRFPEFAEKFDLTASSAPQHENDINFKYQVWRRK